MKIRINYEYSKIDNSYTAKAFDDTGLKFIELASDTRGFPEAREKLIQRLIFAEPKRATEEIDLPQLDTDPEHD